MVTEESCRASQSLLTTLVLADGQTAVWGGDSLAELPVRSGPDDAHADGRIGHRMPVLARLAPELDYGVGWP